MMYVLSILAGVAVALLMGALMLLGGYAFVLILLEIHKHLKL